MIHTGRPVDKKNNPCSFLKNNRKRKGFRAAAFLLFGMLAAGCLHTSPAYASGEKAAFGSESYEWNLGETSAVGIYGTSDDTEVTAVTCTISYDAAMLTYGWGGELTEDGLVTLSGSNSGDAEYRDYIYFVPAMAGETTLTIESMEITGADGSVTETESAEVTVSIPIPESCQLTELSVNGETVDGFDPATASYSLEVDADVEDAAVTASAGSAEVEISDTALAEGENTIYVTVNGTDGSAARYTLYIDRAQLEEETAVSDEADDADTGSEGTAAEESDDADAAGAADAQSASEGAFAVSFSGLILPLIVVIVVIVVIVIIVIAVRRRQKNRRTDEIRERYLEADKRAEAAIRNHTIRNFDDDEV